MKRLKDYSISGFTDNDTRLGVNLVYGGQQGYSPVLGKIESGVPVSNWISNQAYVSKDVIPVLIQAPEFFKWMPDPKLMLATLKSILETHSLTIEGLNSSISVEDQEHAVGGAGEQQEEAVNVTRERTTPTHTFVEKMGKPIQRFLETWIRYGIMDENSKIPLVTHLDTFDLGDQIYDSGKYTMTVLYIEPDPTYTKVVNAWLCTNMRPKSAGDNTGKKDKSAGGELLNHSIEFTAITTPLTTAVYELASTILSQISQAAIPYHETPAFVNAKDADVADDALPEGFLSTASQPTA